MSGDTMVVFGAMGYLVVVAALLNIAGIGSSPITLPGDPSSPSQSTTNTQGFAAAVTECIFTGGFLLPLFLFDATRPDCSQQTTTRWFAGISNLVDFVFSIVAFLFQMLTYQLPITTWLNTLIILPPAIALAFVGIRTIRGIGA